MKNKGGLKCPECQTWLLPGDYGIESFSPYHRVTLNCAACEVLLLLEDGESLRNFHKATHEECSSWPADGQGTHVLEVSEEEK